MLAEFAPMEGVERMNAVMMYSNQRVGFAQYNLYAMDIDRGNRNCYSCGEFGYLVRNCRNRENRIGDRRRLEYRERRMIERGNRQDNNLNGDKDLIILD